MNPRCVVGVIIFIEAITPQRSRGEGVAHRVHVQEAEVGRVVVAAEGHDLAKPLATQPATDSKVLTVV